MVNVPHCYTLPDCSRMHRILLLRIDLLYTAYVHVAMLYLRGA